MLAEYKVRYYVSTSYQSASKIGKKEYHACVYKGKYPYLPVLENLVDESDIDSEVSLGQIRFR